MCKIPIILDKDLDRLIAISLQNGDTLATPRESQMLMNMTGISINSKPRKDGRFQGYLLAEGDKKYFYGRSREEVATKIKNYLMEGSKPKKKKRAEKSTPLFKNYVVNWIEKYKAPNLKDKSIKSIKDSLAPAMNKLGETQIGKISSDDIQDLLIGIKAERSRDLCRTYLNQIFEKAEKQEIIKKNPCSLIEIKKHKAKTRDALTPEQQQTFLSYTAGMKHSLLFRFLLFTGLRIGEALALTKSDLNFENKTVSVNKNVVFIDSQRIVQDKPKSEAGIRNVPIPNSICEELKMIPTDDLFPLSYNAVSQSLQKISSSINIHISCHILRHTYNTRLEEAGIPGKLRQYLMGHAKLDTTENIYTHTQEHYVLSTSDKVREVFDTK